MELSELSQHSDVIKICSQYLKYNPEFKDKCIACFNPIQSFRDSLVKSQLYRDIIQEHRITSGSKWVSCNAVMKHFGMHFISAVNIESIRYKSCEVVSSADSSYYVILDEDRFLMFKCVFINNSCTITVHRQASMNQAV